MTLFPCPLVLAWPVFHKQPPQAANWWFPSALVDRLVHLVIYRRRAIFSVLAVLTALAVVGILRIRVETNPLAYFRDNTAISRHFHDIYRHLSGSFPLHLQIQSAREDYFLSMDALKQLTDYQRFLETLPGVDKSLAFTDYLMLVNYVSNRFDPAYYKLPERDFEIRMLGNQFKSLLGRDILQRYVSEDLKSANITMLAHLSSAGGFIDTQKKIRSYCDRHRVEGISCRTTGFGLVMSLGSRHLVKGQVWSLLITLGIIFALIHLMFLSFKIGTLAMTANLFPILVSFGAMGWLGIDLSMGTCLIASTVMGLAVDDTIHYLARYRLAYRRELNSAAAIRTTLNQVGPPIVSTSVAICAGFSILMLSSFTPTAVFGLLMTLAMVYALSGGLLILPALLSKVSPITLAEIFQIRIGGDQLQKTVPLLKGKNRIQVHRILKAGEIMRIEAGSHLFDQGDLADRMYVVISGVYDAVLSESGNRQDRRNTVNLRVNQLKVGDVIGEMGLISSGYRCVSVLAVASGEVLALGREHLAHIRRLHPRTASQFFANLSAILT
jgi:predicted RND superfamily exporter protein